MVSCMASYGLAIRLRVYVLNRFDEGENRTSLPKAFYLAVLILRAMALLTTNATSKSQPPFFLDTTLTLSKTHNATIPPTNARKVTTPTPTAITSYHLNFLPFNTGNGASVLFGFTAPSSPNVPFASALVAAHCPINHCTNSSFSVSFLHFKSHPNSEPCVQKHVVDDVMQP